MAVGDTSTIAASSVCLYKIVNMSTSSAEIPASLLFESVVVATSPVFLDFISTRDANALRLTSSLFLEVVTGHRWDDIKTEIGDSVAVWRKGFPRAVGAPGAEWISISRTCTEYTI